MHSDAMSGLWTRFCVLKRAQTVWLELGFQQLLDGIKTERRVSPSLPTYITEDAYGVISTLHGGVKNSQLVVDIFDTTPSVIAQKLAGTLGWLRRVFGPA